LLAPGQTVRGPFSFWGTEKGDTLLNSATGATASTAN
jgi:hypothetical protein